MRTHNEKMSIYHGMASAVATNMSNSYIPIFAITILEATNYQVGLISSLPPLVTLLMTLPAAILLNRAIEQKKLITFSVLAARFVFLLIAFVNYVPGSFGSWLLLLLIAMMSVPNTLANMGWQSFIGNIIEDHRRAQFFSDRNRLLTIIGLIVTLTIGLVMKDRTAGAITYQILFMFTFILGIVELYFLMKHDEPVREQSAGKKRAMDWSIFKNNRYVLFLVVALVFNFGWQMAWGLFNIYNIRYAGATIFWVSMFSVGSMVTQIFSFSFWRKWSQKYGNMRVFVWVAFGMSSAPLLTVLSTNYYYLVGMYVLSGFFVSGTTLILFNLLLEISPQEVRTYCITSYNVLLAIISFTSPQIGIWVLEMYSMETAMYLATAMRLLAAIGFLILYMIGRKRSEIV